MNLSKIASKSKDYLKTNYIDVIFDFFLIFIFDILASLFVARLLIMQGVRIVVKEFAKNKISDKIKEKVIKK